MGHQGADVGELAGVARPGEDERQEGLQGLHRVEQAHAGRGQQVQRMRRQLRMGLGRGQADERVQAAPGREVQAGDGLDLACGQVLHDLRHLLKAQPPPRLRHLPAHHGQVARSAGGTLVQQHQHRVRGNAATHRAVAERHPRDGAQIHIDPRHVARGDKQFIESPAAQPGLQAQVQPQTRRAAGREGAACEGGAPGFPALAHRVPGMQVVCRWRDQVAGMFPANAKALGIECFIGPGNTVLGGGLRTNLAPRALRHWAQGSCGQGGSCLRAGFQREVDLRHGRLLDRHRDIPGTASVRVHWLNT